MKSERMTPAVRDEGFTRRGLLARAALSATAVALGGMGVEAMSSSTAIAATGAVQPHLAYTALQPSSYAHPGLLHTASDLSDIAARVGTQAQPWYSGFQRLAANGRANAGWAPRPLADVLRGGTGQNYMQLSLIHI